MRADRAPPTVRRTIEAGQISWLVRHGRRVDPQDANNRFIAVVEAALAGEPQKVTRRGQCPLAAGAAAGPAAGR